MTETDETAQRIADKGRDALIARLRPAFEQAAAAHSDVLDLGPEQLEAMVMRAVDRADGLQWRRALASVATEELGISLGAALSHPAVARAQELAGAPSYEQSLAQLGPLPGSTAPAAQATPAETELEAQAEAEAEHEMAEAEAEHEMADAEAEHEMADAEAEHEMAEAAAERQDEPEVEPDGGPAAHKAADPVLPGMDATEAADEDEDAKRPATAEWERVAVAGSEIETPPDPIETDDEPPVRAPVAAAGPDHEPPYDEYEDDDEEDLHGGPEATASYDVPGSFVDDDDHDDDLDVHAALDDDEDYDSLRVAVVHLGGIANLAPAEGDIELQMSEDGLDIVRGGREILGRLEWDQVKALEVPVGRNRRRMRRGAPTHLVVRTARGDASFEVPEISPPELEQHLAPIVARHIRKH